MFDAIAPTYDRLNRLISLGLDSGWRRSTVDLALCKKPTLLLDVGCGTGDLVALALRRAQYPLLAVGIDFSAAMLQAGQSRVHAAGGLLLQADALALPISSGGADALVSAFAVRNIPDRAGAFLEWARVLGPGGRLVILEMTPMGTGLLARLFRIHFGVLAPWLGRMISRHPFAYSYLPASVERFPGPELLADELRQAGFDRVAWRRLGFGSVAIHVADLDGTVPACS